MLRNISLNTKLTVLTSLSVVLGLVVACTAFWVNDARTIQQGKMDELFGIGRTLAFNCTGVLTFQNQEAAHDLLSALESHEFIEHACLRDGAGEVFAWTGPEPDAQAIPIADTASWTMGDNKQLVATVPIFDPDFPEEKLGALTLVSTTRQLDEHFWNYLSIVALTVVVALLVAMVPLVIMQREISTPILRLAETAESITGNEDYSVRVYRNSGDEIGLMYKAFNGLLDRIQQNEQQILRAQKQLVEACERAEYANESKSRFLANMSHEIRTPLTGILGFTDLLISESRLSTGNQNEYLQTIKKSGKHLLGLINDVLDLSRIEAGQLSVERVQCSPHQVISEVVSVLRVKALEKNLSFEYRWMTGIPSFIESDPARLRQLVMNLVGNAVKFTSKGGVAILASVEPSLRHEGQSNLVVEVVDTGVGIAADKVGQVFLPFVQADSSVTRRFGGTGLGLAISRNLARQLGGDLTVVSEPGRGSAFRLTIDAGNLDRVEMVRGEVADAIVAVQSPEPAERTEMGPARVLLVEDGDINRRFISAVLERSGASVATAENGAIGYELAMKQEFDLVLMDMQMPVMDGYTAARKLRRNGFRKPIVALTAHAMVGDRDKCISAGCTDYLTKPIDADILISSLAVYVRSLAPAARAHGPHVARTRPTSANGERVTR